MYRKKRSLEWAVIGLFILLAILLIGSLAVDAQYWQPLPPYNLLWPLWSPALSPLIGGVPTPLVSTLTKNTVLPAQPALFWDPAFEIPYLLYNVPVAWGGGMVYFDPYFGLNPWPPDYLIDPVTLAPAPISLAAGFASLTPTPLLETTVFYANLLYISEYPWLGFGVLNPITKLLTPGEIWGLTPIL